MEDRRACSIGVQHDFVEFLAGTAGLCEVQILDLALALLVCGFLRAGFDFDFVVGVAIVAILAGFGGGCFIGGWLDCGDWLFAVGVAFGAVAIVVIHFSLVSG